MHTAASASPLQSKSAVTGDGSASVADVQSTVTRALVISQPANGPNNSGSVTSSSPSKASSPIRTRSRPLLQPFAALGKGRLPKYVPVGPDDPQDPYIIAEASAMNNDPNRIFAFVLDQVKYEAYVGSVRGARGTLWAMAGNTLDKSSLLVALLGAAGYTAQYEHANIAGTTAQQNLILTMFPQQTTFVGCIPPGSFTDDPRGDTAAYDYYWVQYGSGGNNTIALDPNVPGSQPGQANQTPDSNFTTVPASLRQQVTVQINAEIYNQAGSLFGLGPATTTVLTQTFDASALVGNIITAGNLVSASAGGGLDITATTFTYTPFLLIGSGGPNVGQDQIVTGTPYQEVYTNFALSSQILTGLFLQVNADDYTDTPRTYTHTMFDRLGPAARQGNASVSLNLPSPPAPAMTQFDLTTVNITTARQPLSGFQAQQTRLTNAYNAYEAFKPQIATLPTSGTLTPTQQETEVQGAYLSEYLTIAENELITMGYNYTADLAAQQLQIEYFSRVFPNSPRITIASSSFNRGNAQEMLDVLKNDMDVIDGVGQNRSAPFGEEIARGMLESLIESSILNQATGQTDAIGIGEVFGALGDPNLLTVVGPQTGQIPSNPEVLTSTTLSADAQTLILDDVAAGNVAITPNQMVSVNGVTTVGWWEVNPNTGHTISHFVNGGHQALFEYSAISVFDQFDTEKMVEYIGGVEGFASAGLVFTADVLQGVASGTLKTTKTLLANPLAPAGIGPPMELPGFDKSIAKFLDFLTTNLLGLGPMIPNLLGGLEGHPNLEVGLEVGGTVKEFTGQLAAYLEGFQDGYYGAIKAFAANLPVDPDSLDFISTPLGLSQTPPTPGTTPGVQIGAIAVDPTWTMPINGNSLPLVFDLPITNTGASTDTFNIQISDQYLDFQIYPTVPSLTLQGGQSGMVNVCVTPTDATGSTLPPAGQAQNYSVTVTSATNSQVTASAAQSFNAPPIAVLEMSTNPSNITTTPGGMAAVSLTLGSVGNVSPGAVSITATIPTGITVTGLTSPVTVPFNSTVSQPLSIVAAGNLATATYTITLVVTYTAPGGAQQTITAILPVTVTDFGICALSASTSAAHVSKNALAADLAGLAFDMDASGANPSNTAFSSRVAGDMNLILSEELTASYFQSIVPTLTADTNAVASASAATLPGALSTLSTAVCSIGTLLTRANTTTTSITLTPSNALADSNLALGPNQSAQWNISITNSSPLLHVYNLSTTGVPSGVTVQFSQPTITLGPSGSASPPYYSYSTLLTLTTGSTFNTPFSFTVVATPQDAPEFPVSAPGTVLARPESISVDQVTLTPPYTTAGTPVNITARVFAVVNEQMQASLQVSVTDPNGNPCCGTNSNSFTLTPSQSVQTITLNPMSTTNFINGVYTLSVQAEYGGVPQGPPATAALLIGAPLTGALSASPSIVPPGSSTVQVALNITRDSTPNPVSTLVGSLNVNGVPRAMTLFQNGTQQLAYVCSDSQVNIVDVTSAANMQLLGTFANDILTTETGAAGDPTNGVVSGFQVMSCSIFNNSDFIISYSRFDGNTTDQPIPTHFATYSLANPLAPTLVGSVVDINRSDSVGLYVAGNTALMYNSTTNYDLHDYFIGGFYGDIWAADLTNAPTTGAINFLNDVYSCGGINASTNDCNNVTNVPTATSQNGSCVSTGTKAIANDPTRGGPYQIGAGTAVNSTTAYFSSSNGYGINVEDPTCPQVIGQVLVVDTSTPSNPTIVTSVPVPATAFITGIAVQNQGNLAIAVGDSLGYYSIIRGLVGNLVITSFDISNPQSPQLLNSITTQLSDQYGSYVVPLGNNTFAVGNTTLNGQAQLVLVDATNPNALRYIPYQAPIVANPAIAQNGYFYALSGMPASTVNALSAFQLSEITGPQLTVSFNLPTNGNATLVPGSFNPAPTTTTPGSGSITCVWDQPTQNTISWNMSLTSVNPGDVTTLVNSGQMNYTLPSLGAGVYPLGSLSVLTQHILSISPASQNVSYGAQTANYTATVTNPSNAQLTFTPSIIVPPGWSGSVPTSVTVPANGSQTFNVAITPPANVQLGAITFNVAVNSSSGAYDSVPAVLSVEQSSADLGTSGNISFAALTAAISPSQVTVGQGDSSGPYTITFTNAGNTSNQFQINNPSNLPNGLAVGTYQPTSYETIGPNLSSSISGTITAQRGTTPGSYPITIPVHVGSTSQDLSLTVNVSSAGIQGYISPSSGPVGPGFILALSNIGQQQDTFSLSVVGALAQAASIKSSVTLAAGAQATLPITFASLNNVLPANTQLQIRVVSQNDPNAQAVYSATITVGQSKSVTAAIAPSPASVPGTPNSVSLVFSATNTGNVSDTYTAGISGTTGAVTATLTNAGSPMVIPALGTVNIPLSATLSSGSHGTVTVTITSSTSSTINAQTTATITTAASRCDLTNAGSVGIADVQTMVSEALGTAQPLNDLDGSGAINVVDIETCIDEAIGPNPPQSQSSARPQSHPLTNSRITGPGAVGLAYSLVDLGTLGGNRTTVQGLNNLGQAVGSSDTGEPAGTDQREQRPVSHAFLWEAGQMTDLGALTQAAGDESAAYSVNDAREAAGVFTGTHRGDASFLYANGAVIDFAGVPRGAIVALNNLGEVVGAQSADGASPAHAFLWKAGALSDLGTLGGSGSLARAVNDSGQVVGVADLAGDSARHAFLYDGETLTDLGTLGGRDSDAFGLNSAGLVVGAALTAGGAQHAFLYRAGAMTDLGTLGGGATSQANGVNANGVVVGWSSTAANQQHAFVWISGRMIDLNSVVAMVPGVWLHEAVSINDLGQIAVNASDGHAYLVMLPGEFQ
jgi:probable HAF family extracellular repeat protein